ncbi:MAG: outer membrane lipoprotein carrier protein LolA [Rhodospirillaceae bacterium]|jgi:outer membrane lipoprotein-sorting protein|nr:outer membrane lipoprotein carrier protein LolA [Rhodospirillaceae bacterium]
MALLLAHFAAIAYLQVFADRTKLAMMQLKLRLPHHVCAIALILCLWTAAANAQDATPVELTSAEQSELARIENYMNDIQNLRAQFLQVSARGEEATGLFYLRRPGRLRVEYDPPFPVLIIGDGFLLHYHDRELNQISDWPIFDTPLGALTDTYVRFNDRLVVTGFENRDGLFAVRVVQREDPAQGSLTLIYTDAPLALRQWQVDDAQGLTTTVTLFELETNVDLDNELFVFDDPREQQSR